MNTALIERLTGHGIYAFHAAALRRAGTVVVVAGLSGAGKTTLALALAGRGLGLLSDELALALPDSGTIAPYRRRAMIRATTIGLVPELEFLAEREPEPIGAEARWPFGADELELAFGCRPAEAGPLGHVVLLEAGDPAASSTLEAVGTGIAAAELLHLAPASAVELELVIDRLGELLRGVRCVRLRRGTLASSLDLLEAWLAAADE